MTDHSRDAQTSPAGSVLLGLDDSHLRRELTSVLAHFGYRLYPVENWSETVEILGRQAADACVLDWPDADEAIHEAVGQLAGRFDATRFVIVGATPEHDAAASASQSLRFSSGLVFDRLAHGESIARICGAVRGAVQQAQLLAENRRLKRQLSLQSLRDVIGQSAVMQELREQIRRAADSDRPALICGERGTGTNLAAQAIHDAGRRAHRPFVRLDCQVLTSEILERELFGAIRADGSSSGSAGGWLEAAAGGTIFLDDFDQIAIPLQARLAGVLQRNAFRIPGRSEPRRLDVRILAAAHFSRPDRIEGGPLVSELRDGLGTLVVATPSLKDRREDIGLLTEHFLARAALREGRPAKRLTLEALELLKSYDWPGHVAELQTVVERACALDTNPRLTADMIRPWLAQPAGEPADSSGLTLRAMERKLIETTFARFGGNRERTAQALRIGLRTLSGKLREYGYPPRGGPGSNRQDHDRAA